MQPSELREFNKRPPFDPYAYSKDIREHPERYMTLRSLVGDAAALRRIKQAPTLQALKEAFQPSAKAAKAAGDTLLLDMLTEAAKQRKIELTPKE